MPYETILGKIRGKSKKNGQFLKNKKFNFGDADSCDFYFRRKKLLLTCPEL